MKSYIFECDPDKNDECGKTGCYKNGGLCLHTIKEICAVTAHDGNAYSVGTIEEFPEIVHDEDNSGRTLNGLVYIPKESQYVLFLHGKRMKS